MVAIGVNRPPTDWEYADTAPFTFVDGVEEAIAAAKEFAADRDVDVAADQVVVNQVPVVFGPGRPFFARIEAAEHPPAPDPITLHSTLGYRSPVEYEKISREQKAA